MGSNPSYFKNCGDDCPVENVSWNDVQEFIKKLNLKTGLKYRLPTEAEWEYAARGTDGRIYPWGNTFDGRKLNFCDKNCEFIWKDANVNDGYKGTSPVGSYPDGVSPFGVHDMAGNVWEWCNDWYDEDYYSNSPERNPLGPSSGSGRVLRGGSWDLDAWHCRVSDRDWLWPGYRFGFNGFQLVLPSA